MYGTLQQPQQQRRMGFEPGAWNGLRIGLIACWIGPIMYKAYGHARDAGADKMNAAGHALYCGIRWKAWGFTWIYWFLTQFWFFRWFMASEYELPNKMWYLNNGVAIVALGVTFAQNVEVSMFRKRVLYKLVWPFHKLLGWMPWYVLNTTILIPLLIVIHLCVEAPAAP